MLLEIELSYYDVSILHISHYTTQIPPLKIQQLKVYGGPAQVIFNE